MLIFEPHILPMNKALLLLLMLAGPASTLLRAQSSDYALQPNAKTNVTAAVAVEDGYLWVTNGINPKKKGLPVIQKWDKDGQILWEKTLNIDFTYWGYDAYELYFLKILTADQNILLAANVFVDFAYYPMLILLDSEGKFLDNRILPNTFLSFFGELTSIYANQLFPLVYLIDGELFRLDNFDTDPVSLGINTSISGLAPYANGQILAALRKEGVVRIDRQTGITIDSLHKDVSDVNFIYTTKENNILLAGYSRLILLDDQFNVIVEKQHNLGRLTAGFFDEQTWYLNGLKDVHRFDSALNYIGVLQEPTSDATIKRVLPGETHHWAIGNETFNAFRMPLQFDGTFEPPMEDVSLTWLQAEKIDLIRLDQWHFQMTLKGVELHVTNLGQDTLEEIVINWDLPNDLCLNDEIYKGNQRLNFLKINNLGIAPGETTIISQLFDTTYSIYYNNCYLFLYWDELCFELSIPNQRLDANNDNDRVCLPITFTPLISDLDQEEASLVQVYPNPFASTLTIAGIPIQCATIDIYDGLGRAMQRITPTSEKLTVDLSANGSGLNHLVFRCSDGIILGYETLIKE